MGDGVGVLLGVGVMVGVREGVGVSLGVTVGKAVAEGVTVGMNGTVGVSFFPEPVVSVAERLVACGEVVNRATWVGVEPRVNVTSTSTGGGKLPRTNKTPAVSRPNTIARDKLLRNLCWVRRRNIKNDAWRISREY